MSAAFDMYMKEVKEHPLLSIEEERELAARAYAGNDAAQKALAAATLGFVIDMAKTYRCSNVLFEDLVCAGNIGLCIAAKRFNPSHGTKFITYASWWIRYEMQKAIRENAAIHYPADKYSEMVKSDSYCCSLDASIGSDGESSLLDFLADDVERIEDKAVMKVVDSDVLKALARLSQEERKVLMHHYGLADTEKVSLSKLADMMDLSREGVRLIEKRAKRRLSCFLAGYKDTIRPAA